MTRDIRAFLSIDLPPDARAALASVGERLRRSGVEGLRLVKPQSMHLTLRFFGNISQQDVARIVRATADAAAGIEPFTLRMGDPGAHPSAGRARVLWVGLSGDTACLVAARRRVDSALERAGIPPERREFRPHLTIARLRDSLPQAERGMAARAFLATLRPPAAAFRVERLTLVSSVLSPSGAEHSPLCVVRLGARVEEARRVTEHAGLLGFEKGSGGLEKGSGRGALQSRGGAWSKR